MIIRNMTKKETDFLTKEPQSRDLAPFSIKKRAELFNQNFKPRNLKPLTITTLIRCSGFDEAKINVRNHINMTKCGESIT